MNAKLKRFAYIFLLYLMIGLFFLLITVLVDLVFHKLTATVEGIIDLMRTLIFVIGCIWICGWFHRKESFPPSEYSSALSDFFHRHLLKVLLVGFLGYIYMKYGYHSKAWGAALDLWEFLFGNSDQYSVMILPYLFFEVWCIYSYFFGYLFYCIRDSQLRVKKKKLLVNSPKHA